MTPASPKMHFATRSVAKAPFSMPLGAPRVAQGSQNVAGMQAKRPFSRNRRGLTKNDKFAVWDDAGSPQAAQGLPSGACTGALGGSIFGSGALRGGRTCKKGPGAQARRPFSKSVKNGTSVGENQKIHWNGFGGLREIIKKSCEKKAYENGCFFYAFFEARDAKNIAFSLVFAIVCENRCKRRLSKKMFRKTSILTVQGRLGAILDVGGGPLDAEGWKRLQKGNPKNNLILIRV